MRISICISFWITLGLASVINFDLFKALQSALSKESLGPSLTKMPKAPSHEDPWMAAESYCFSFPEKNQVVRCLEEMHYYKYLIYVQNTHRRHESLGAVKAVFDYKAQPTKDVSLDETYTDLPARLKTVFGSQVIKGVNSVEWRTRFRQLAPGKVFLERNQQLVMLDKIAEFKSEYRYLTLIGRYDLAKLLVEEQKRLQISTSKSTSQNKGGSQIRKFLENSSSINGLYLPLLPEDVDKNRKLTEVNQHRLVSQTHLAMRETLNNSPETRSLSKFASPQSIRQSTKSISCNTAIFNTNSSVSNRNLNLASPKLNISDNQQSGDLSRKRIKHALNGHFWEYQNKFYLALTSFLTSVQKFLIPKRDYLKLLADADKLHHALYRAIQSLGLGNMLSKPTNETLTSLSKLLPKILHNSQSLTLDKNNLDPLSILDIISILEEWGTVVDMATLIENDRVGWLDAFSLSPLAKLYPVIEDLPTWIALLIYIRCPHSLKTKKLHPETLILEYKDAVENKDEHMLNQVTQKAGLLVDRAKGYAKSIKLYSRLAEMKRAN